MISISGDKEQIIVSLTTWRNRISNLPVVLNTIYSQTLLPDKVVLNLAYEEVIPESVNSYLVEHNVVINRVPDTKVYKKILPTILQYPDDCIIAIDDDWLYPNDMIEIFMTTHRLYPGYPISGNNVIISGFQCHCGCASLVKSEYYKDYLSQIDSDVMSRCPADDIVYTFFANKAGHPYIRTISPVFSRLEPYCNNDSYTDRFVAGGGNDLSLDYLFSRFGKSESSVFFYGLIQDNYFINLLSDIISERERNMRLLGYNDGMEYGMDQIRRSRRYKIGDMLVSHLQWIKSLIKAK